MWAVTRRRTQRLRGRGKRTHGDFHTLDRRCKATWVQSRGVVGEGDAGNVFLKDVLPKAARKGRRRVSQREERVRGPRDTCRGARAFFMMSSGGAERGAGRVWTAAGSTPHQGAPIGPVGAPEGLEAGERPAQVQFLGRGWWRPGGEVAWRVEAGGGKPRGEPSQWSGPGQTQVLDQGRAGGQREGDVFSKLGALVSGSSRFWS